MTPFEAKRDRKTSEIIEVPPKLDARSFNLFDILGDVEFDNIKLR